MVGGHDLVVIPKKEPQKSGGIGKKKCEASHSTVSTERADTLQPPSRGISVSWAASLWGGDRFEEFKGTTSTLISSTRDFFQEKRSPDEGGRLGAALLLGPGKKQG